MTAPQPVPRIAAIETAPASILVVTWEDGRTDRVDLSGWIARGGPFFQRLEEDALFRQATLGEHGWSVQWGGDEDLSIDSFHLGTLAEAQRPVDQEELARWQGRLCLSNQEAAELLGVRTSTWHNYKSGTTRIPRGVQIACRALERDRSLFVANFHPRHPGGRPAAIR